LGGLGEAADGEAAVIQAKELKPDVVILDLELPVVDGLTSSCDSECLPGVPILMHTLHSPPQIEVEAKKNGVWKALPKSQGAEIVSVIEEILTTEARTRSRTSTRSSIGHR
jgi:DNA-binding response OmpR family regulator